MALTDLSTATLSELLALVDRPAVGTVEQVEFPKPFGEHLLQHPWRATIEEMAKWGGSPAWSSVDNFLEWCCRSHCPKQIEAWEKAGDRSSAFITEDMAFNYITLLGRLVMERGRDEVDRQVETYARERVAAAKARNAAETREAALLDRLRKIIEAHPQEARVIVFGHLVGYALKDIEEQETDPDSYDEGRGLREEAGMMNPPSHDMRSIARAAKIAITPGEWLDKDAVDHVYEIVHSQGWQGSPVFIGPTAIDCANGDYARRWARAEPPLETWWADGYRRAIARFGPDATLGNLAAYSGGN